MKPRAAIGLPGLSEPQVVRHYTRLSQKNYGIDSGLFPLGSCTMKHNQRLNEKMTRLPGNAAEIVERLAGKGVLAGVPLSRFYPGRPELANLLLVASTELTSDEDRTMLVKVLSSQ